MAKPTIKSNPRVTEIFEDLDKYLEFCQDYGYRYNEADLYNFKSCEMISDDLYLQIAQRYPGRAVWIEVAEDGENGALIKYEISRPSQSIVI